MKKLLFAFTLLTASLCSPAQDWNSQLKQLGTQALPHAKTAAYWALLTIPFWRPVFNYVCKRLKPIDKKELADPVVAHFVRQEMAKVGVTNPKIPILVEDKKNNNGAKTDGRTVILDKPIHDKIRELLQAEDIEGLARWKALIQHEASHIFHSDTGWEIARDLVTPFAMHGLIKASSKYLFPSLTGTKKLLAQAAVGVVGFYSAALLEIVSNRREELRADDHIQNDPQLLRQFRELLLIDEALYEFGNYQHEKIVRFPSTILYTFDHGGRHPCNYERAERLEERVAKINGER